MKASPVLIFLRMGLIILRIEQNDSEDVHEKVKIAINQGPLRPVKEVHEGALNEVLRGITDENDRLEFCQQMPTHRQCERTEYRYRNTLIPQTLPRQEILKQMESSSTIREMKIGIVYSLSPILR